MKEVKVRHFHRRLGMVVVWFLLAQVLTGLALSLGELRTGGAPMWLDQFLGALHFGGNPLGGVYRLVLALATIAQGISGIIIYRQIRARSRKL